jgi:hypothetical protein
MMVMIMTHTATERRTFVHGACARGETFPSMTSECCSRKLSIPLRFFLMGRRLRVLLLPLLPLVDKGPRPFSSYYGRLSVSMHFFIGLLLLSRPGEVLLEKTVHVYIAFWRSDSFSVKYTSSGIASMEHLLFARSVE